MKIELGRTAQGRYAIIHCIAGNSVLALDLFAYAERLVDGRYETDIGDRFFAWRHRGIWMFLGG